MPVAIVRVHSSDGEVFTVILISGQREELERFISPMKDSPDANHYLLIVREGHVLCEDIYGSNESSRRYLLIANISKTKIIVTKDTKRSQSNGNESNSISLGGLLCRNQPIDLDDSHPHDEMQISNRQSLDRLERDRHDSVGIRQLLHLQYQNELLVKNAVGIVLHIASMIDEDSSIISINEQRQSRSNEDGNRSDETYAVTLRDVNYPDIITLYIKSKHTRRRIVVGSIILVKDLTIHKTASLRRVYLKISESKAPSSSSISKS